MSRHTINKETGIRKNQMVEEETDGRPTEGALSSA
jgi:hypothetical protein